jgi:NADH:ubiquinone reductase (H+-translocating)
MSVSDAVDGSSTGTEVPLMWVLLRPPRFGGAKHASGHANWSHGAYGSLGKFGLFRGGFIQGRVAELGHVLLYRSYQSQLHGFWRGGLIWLADTMNSYVRPKLRLG